MILAFEVGRQYIFIGAVNGLSYALLALGVILIYRSSRIINFAVGATGVLASQVLAHLVIRYGAPYWLGVVLAVLGGAVFLGVAELTVVRRLFTAPRVILLVATIGLAQLAQALIFALPEASAEDKRHRFPHALEPGAGVVRHTDRGRRVRLVRGFGRGGGGPQHLGAVVGVGSGHPGHGG